MASLILVRHGKSHWNKENRFTGWTDIDLAQEGIAEAESAAQDIKTKQIHLKNVQKCKIE